MKIIQFLKEASVLKLILIGVVLTLPGFFVEESFPTIFILLRLISFSFIFLAVVKLVNRI